MSFMKTNSVKITVGSSTFDSLDDFGLAIENTDYIRTPQAGTDNLVRVPGKSGMLDMTDAVFGGQYFYYREISIHFGTLHESEAWDGIISTLRNLFEGRTVKLEFATLPGWYFTGRCVIDEFQHSRALGTFKFSLPYADPWMYQDVTIDVPADSGSDPVTLTVNRMTVIPTFVTLTNAIITYQGTTYTLDAGTHQISDIRLETGSHQLTVNCTENVIIRYRNGSL